MDSTDNDRLPPTRRAKAVARIDRELKRLRAQVDALEERAKVLAHLQE